MSFEQVIAELPNLSFEQRQELILRVVELDDLPLALDERLVEQRLAAHSADTSTAIPLEKFKNQLRMRFKA